MTAELLYTQGKSDEFTDQTNQIKAIEEKNTSKTEEDKAIDLEKMKKNFKAYQ